MKYLYYKPLGQVFWKEEGILYFTPMCLDGTFYTADGGVVEIWEEGEEFHKAKVNELLA